MKEEERNCKLKEILKIYTKQNISLTKLHEQYNISTDTIKKYLTSNGVEIKK